MQSILNQHILKILDSQRAFTIVLLLPWLLYGLIIILAISYCYRMIFLFLVLIFIVRFIQLGPYSQISILQRWSLILLLNLMLTSMLIPCIGHSCQDQLTRVGLDSLTEFVFSPFLASSLLVIDLSMIVMVCRPSALTAQQWFNLSIYYAPDWQTSSSIG